MNDRVVPDVLCYKSFEAVTRWLVVKTLPVSGCCAAGWWCSQCRHSVN